MVEVSVDRFVRAPPAVVRRALTPANVVAFEGSFDVAETTETDKGTLVTATGGRLMALTYRVEGTDDGCYYEQAGDAGPFDRMETWIGVDPEDEGSRVTARSQVEIGLPLPFSARIAAWKRRGELRRLLVNLADEVT